MSMPRLTIGLVVYNGDAHLRDALDSLCHQTFRDFVLVIVDNASTDNTAAIAREYCARDPRIRYVRQPHNIGPVANFVSAAAAATTELFCWATHDDVRKSTCLHTLIGLLDEHPAAGMACSAVRNMDPDGTLRDVRPETSALPTSVTHSSARRIIDFLRTVPGTPFYGVFRTHTLQALLHILRGYATEPGPFLISFDTLFLGEYIKRWPVVLSNEPLLMFRRGGLSHRIDIYGSFHHYLRQILRYIRLLAQATTPERATLAQQVCVRLARWRYILAFLLSQPMRRMTGHYFRKSLPRLSAVTAQAQVQLHPAFRRLRQRVRSLPRGSRIAIFGGGKHTHRTWNLLRAAIDPHAAITAIVDDHPATCQPIEGVQPIGPAEFGTMQVNVLIVSSDTYEASLAQRARDLAPACCQVWAIYDLALESVAAATVRSAASIELRKPSISPAASYSSAAARD